MIICLVVYFILVHFHVHPYYPEKNYGFLPMVIVWMVTLFGGDFLSKQADRYFLKRDAIKIIKGLGHKKSDIEKIEILKDGDEEVVEITLKDNKGE